jgi:hypothetical protein
MKIKSVQVKTIVIINGKQKTICSEDWTEHMQELNAEFPMKESEVLEHVIQEINDPEN